MNEPTKPNPNPNPNPVHSMPGVEPFIDTPEVARRLEKTVRTIQNWCEKGILPKYRVGRSVLFKWSEIEAHLAQNYRVCRRNVTK